tara:strand:- start:661 stop:912 length:252 start_codon:yes stop_codon:yes gene_type:complete
MWLFFGASRDAAQVHHLSWASAMHLIPEPLGLHCQVLGLVVGNTTLINHDGHPFLEGFNVGNKTWVCCGYAAYSFAPAGSLTW